MTYFTFNGTIPIKPEAAGHLHELRDDLEIVEDSDSAAGVENHYFWIDISTTVGPGYPTRLIKVLNTFFAEYSTAGAVFNMTTDDGKFELVFGPTPEDKRAAFVSHLTLEIEDLNARLDQIICCDIAEFNKTYTGDIA